MAFIPRKFFSCTYFISYLTLMLRNCNWDTQFTSPDDIFSYSGSDQLLIVSKNTFKKWPLKDEPWFEEYWFYYNQNVNSKKPWVEVSYDPMVHNCGTVQWSMNIPNLIKEVVPA
jgi:hypothetical protein